MFIVCLTIFFSIMSSLQEVSYVKVHVYCVFDYFLLNLVSISDGELRESACLLYVWLFSSQIVSPLQKVSYVKVHVYCVFDYFLFNLVFISVCELHEKCMFIVFDYFLFNLVFTSVCELRETWKVHVYCVWLFSSQSCLHFSLWVT